MLPSQDVSPERIARRSVLILALLHARFEYRKHYVLECLGGFFNKFCPSFFISYHAFKVGVVWDLRHTLGMWMSCIGTKFEAQPE